MKIKRNLTGLFWCSIFVFLFSSCNENKLRCTNQGSQTYIEECAVCHGIYGTGGPSDGLTGDGLKAAWSEKIRIGFGEMSEFTKSDISDEEMGLLMTYLVEDTADSKIEMLYRKACSSCHGLSPEVGGNGPALKGEKLKLSWMDTVKHGTTDGKMLSYMAEMCDGDIDAVISFVLEGEFWTPDAGLQ